MGSSSVAYNVQRRPMKLLLDSDAFGKLGIAGLLESAASALGCTLAECARLPALPSMLRRGRLRTQLGDARADALIPVADSIPAVPRSESRWLDVLARIPGVDPGEAQLLAATADHGLLLLSGDKRAMNALAGQTTIVEALSGRIVVVDAIVIELCDTLGAEHVRALIAPAVAIDTALRIAFGSQRDTPVELLRANLDDLAKTAPRELLWLPTSMRPPA